MATSQGCNAEQLGVIIDGPLAGIEVIFQERRGERVFVKVVDVQGMYLLIDAARFEPLPGDG